MLSARRQNLEDDGWVEQNVLALIGEKRFSANHGHVGIRVHTAGGDANAEVGRKLTTARTAKRTVKLGYDVRLQC